MKIFARSWVASAALILSACAAHAQSVELVQTIPLETELAQPGVAHARDAWLELARGARKTIDLGQMYISNAPDSALEAVIVELEKAGARGVKIRMVVATNMANTDPATSERLKKIPGFELRAVDYGKLSGGIHHAKYWIVDGEEFFVGSQNFDWKALTHIHEMGVRIRDAALAAQLRSIFEIDWEMARTGQPPLPVRVAPLPPVDREDIEMVASPPQFNPAGTRDALVAVKELLAQAKQSIRIQLLDYSPVSGNTYWPDLDNALRAAAVRGVKVELLVSDWNTTMPAINHLKSLSLVPNIEVRIATIPAWTGGYLSYARVIHTKMLVIDDQTLWVGTSNWSKGYFTATRGIELIFHRPELAKTGSAIFAKVWTSPYAPKIDPAREYVPPKRD